MSALKQFLISHPILALLAICGAAIICIGFLGSIVRAFAPTRGEVERMIKKAVEQERARKF
jgi:hypothetical protein